MKPFPLLPLLAALLLAGCDYVVGGGTRGGDAPDPIQPVRVGFEVEEATCGCEEYRFKVQVREDGRVLFRGGELSGRTLREELFKRAEVERDLDHPDCPSEIGIELNCDARATWGAVSRVLRACRDPAVRLYRTIYVVACAGTDWPRPFYGCLPRESADPDPAEIDAEGGVVVRLESGADPPDPGALCRRLAARPVEDRERPSLVLAAPDVPAGDVIRTLATFVRAGFENACAWPSAEEER